MPNKSKYLLILLPWLFSSACNQPTTEKQPSPNILFAIADDASFPHMGAYGTTWVNTPAFDRVAREGILFNRAYTPNAKCAPSRSCILTGRNSWQLEEAANHVPYFPEKFKTYPEALGENGYFVGYTAKGWAPGDPGEINGQKRQLTGMPFNEKKTTPPAAHISGNDYAENFRHFLENRPEGKPFCFWYGSTEPHRAYEFQAGINKGGKNLTDIDKVPAFWPDNDTVRADMLDYAYEIEYFDQHLGKILAILEERGELENTIVVVTADNGMPFPRIKGQKYELSNHLPLAIMWPDGIKNPGRVEESLVSFIDFAPTFLELAGLEPEAIGMQPITGKSLIDIFAQSPASEARDYVLLGKERHDVGRPNDQGYPVRGIVKGDYLYLQNFKPDRWPAGNPETGYLNTDGSPTKTMILDHQDEEGGRVFYAQNFGKRPPEELYNITQDPVCIDNLAGDEDFADIKASLKSEMVRELKAQQDPRILGNGDIFDQYIYAGEKHRNFYERYMSGEKMDAGWVNPSDFEPVRK
jgi:N-sulfoglucosamine sulfohydrolase